MKRVTLILFTICNMFVYGLSANTLPYTHHLEESNKTIDLLGDLTSTGTRSLYPIIITQHDNYLEIIFVDNKLGEISIQLSDNMNNHLYQNTINGAQQKILIIPVSNFNNGKYEIKFTNSEDNCLKGQFVIQR